MLSILLIFSCSKQGENETKTFTVSGRLFASCDSLPLADEEIFLATSSVNTAPGGVILARGLTDSQGLFVIHYNVIPDPESSFYHEGLFIRDKNMNNLINVPVNMNVDHVIALLKHSQVFDVFLKVDNPYNNEHEIHYSSDNVQVKQIVEGPFSDQFLYQKEIHMTGEFRHPLAHGVTTVPWWTLNFNYDILGPTITSQFNPGTHKKRIHTQVIYVPCGDQAVVEMMVD